MNIRFKRPRLGLYARFFVLFNATTILLMPLIALGFFTYSEGEVKALIKDRHEKIYQRMTEFLQSDVDLEETRNLIDGPMIEVKVETDDGGWTTWEDFPHSSKLLSRAEQIDSIYFTKYQLRV